MTGKIPNLPNVDRPLHLKGSLSVKYNQKFQRWVVRSWPKGNGGDTPRRYWARAAFVKAAELIKSASADDRAGAAALAKNTPFLERDILMMAAFGNLVQFTTPDGVTWIGARMANITAQQYLDSISTVDGSVLVRTSDGWVALLPGTADYVLTMNAGSGLPQWQPSAGSGGGYAPGTLPPILQAAVATTNANKATFPAAPTPGSLLVAMCFNPTSAAVGSGWTLVVNNTTGTDYGVILTKVAGASESATQQPLSSASITTGAIIIYEFGQTASVTPTLIAASSQSEANALTANTPIYLPNMAGCIGISACAVASPATITKGFNAGTLDVLDNSNTRRLIACHTDISKTPMAGIYALLSAAGNSKTSTCLISI